MLLKQSVIPKNSSQCQCRTMVNKLSIFKANCIFAFFFLNQAAELSIYVIFCDHENVGILWNTRLSITYYLHSQLLLAGLKDLKLSILIHLK